MAQKVVAWGKLVELLSVIIKKRQNTSFNNCWADFLMLCLGKYVFGAVSVGMYSPGACTTTLRHANCLPLQETISLCDQLFFTLHYRHYSLLLVTFVIDLGSWQSRDLLLHILYIILSLTLNVSSVFWGRGWVTVSWLTSYKMIHCRSVHFG